MVPVPKPGMDTVRILPCGTAIPYQTVWGPWEIWGDPQLYKFLTSREGRDPAPNSSTSGIHRNNRSVTSGYQPEVSPRPCDKGSLPLLTSPVPHVTVLHDYGEGFTVMIRMDLETGDAKCSPCLVTRGPTPLFP